MVYSASWQEYRNAEEDSEEHGDVSYSILQWEAKKFRYIYDSWGGDRVTDFLDITVSYSVVACWGCILPTIATLALVVLFISMHLRMYRPCWLCLFLQYDGEVEGISFTSRLS